MYSSTTSNSPKDGSQQRDSYLNPPRNANNSLCFGSFPSLLCICPAPSSAFDTGDWIQKASHLQVPYLWAMLLSYNKPTLNPKSTWMLWSCWLMVRLSAKLTPIIAPHPPINIWKKLNGKIFVVNIASVYQMAKKKDSLHEQNHIIINDT